MKKLVLFVLFFLSITIQSIEITSLSTTDDDVNIENIFANKFYILDRDGKIIYLSEDDIKKMWEEKLGQEGLHVKLDKFKILNSKDSQSGKTYYFLKAVSHDKIIETGAFFSVTKFGMLLAEKKCSCVGCPSGCNLTVFGDRCSCSSCGYGGSQECKKTEETTIGTKYLAEE
ncbi:hypothetical protein IQ37_12845 [Chryseobacterium piperi]|uniref:Uncharacterized protein n=1 Tax=Chryseobacterium piperi TaxID=558152 RepID=A0A086B7T3_9FLAO|nr:hypothetical protein [Chryseobacterium piperi]KFF24997.1 hypothetical protein IQ37_12845 [Chryseobacterium piperi]